MRLEVYQRLFQTIRQSDAVGSELISILNSVSIPQAVVHDSCGNKSFIRSANHITDSLVDQILLDTVESICFENGIRSISHTCLKTLTRIMRITIQNFARFIHASLVPLKPQLDTTNETKTVPPKLENTTMSPVCVVFVVILVS